MKKKSTRLITIAIVLGLIGTIFAGCGKTVSSTDTASKNNGIGQLFRGEPTEEELREINNYAINVNLLENYVREGSIRYNTKEGNRLYDNDALEAVYNDIKNAEAVDTWAGTEYTSAEGFNWNRQEILDRFTVLEDVKLEERFTVFDYLGNAQEYSPSLVEWYYNEDGSVDYEFYNAATFQTTTVGYTHGSLTDNLYRNPLSIVRKLQYFYDGNGMITKIDHVESGDELQLRIIPSYDDNGNIVCETITEADGHSGTVTYNYDQYNRLTSIHYLGDLKDVTYYAKGGKPGEMRFEYHYDESGNVVCEEFFSYGRWNDGSQFLHYYQKTEYSYNNGQLNNAVNTFQEWSGSWGKTSLYSETVDHYAYQYDELGRPLSMIITFGDRVAVSDSRVLDRAEYASCEIKVKYGDYYIYNPQN